MTPVTDPFTLEIVRAHLLVVAEEMFITQGRTSKSPIVYEVLDYACAVTDPEAQLVAQANGVAGFLGALSFAVEDVIRKFGPDGSDPDGLREGDVVATNIPYEGGGSHLSDVSMVMPVFVDGRIVAFTVNKAHWTEIGGKDAGSMTNDATEIYQEGVQLPCIKVVDGGTPVPQVVDLLRANVRTPDATLGDFYAQAAALAVGAARIRELCGRWTAGLVAEAMRTVLERGEAAAREALARIPHGTFEAEDAIPDDGAGGAPIAVKVRVTIDADGFHADFAGTGPQAKGTINCTRVALHAAMRIVFMAIVSPHAPANSGLFRPLSLSCEDGTIFTALRPAPTSTYWEARLVASDVVWKALAAVLPDRLTAGHYLSVCSQVIRTRDPRSGVTALLVEPNAGGWGAGHDKDGEDGLFCMSNGETYVLSSEVAETRYAIRVERYGYDVLPGGEGRHRGGRGLVREYRMLSDGSVTASFGRSEKGAWPVDGGRSGTPNYVEVAFADGRPPLRTGKPTRVPLVAGDLVRLVTGTGAGWGDPARRPRERIEHDLDEGMITPEIAATVYGYEGGDDT